MNLVNRLRHILASPAAGPQGKAGARAYAVGDVHGRLDLLDLLLEAIETDIAGRPRKRNFVVFLGDLIDRGPHSAQVMERLRNWKPAGVHPIFLAGNHEEVMLRVLAGEAGILASWLEFGGSECLASYGVDPEPMKWLREEVAIEKVRAAVPRSHREFLESFGDTFRFGDYLFVHAGIRPGVAVEEQAPFDLRWIREPFLTDSKHHGFVVVHGHTIVNNVEERSNRIAIDTGAYRSGLLTALAVEEDTRWYLTSERAAQSVELTSS